MPIPLPNLDALVSLSIPTPCIVPWGEMRGDDRSRFCGQCERRVFDLSAMTTAEATELLADPSGRPCVRLYRRPDGRVLTADCPAGLRVRVWRGLRRRAAWAASLFAMLFLPACRTATQGVSADAYAEAVSKLPHADGPGGVSPVVPAETDSQAPAEQPQRKNLFAEFVGNGNEFAPWSLSPRVDFPLGIPQVEVAPMPRRVGE